MSFPGLQHLVKSPSKKFVDEVFVAVFENKEEIGELATALQIDENEARQVFIKEKREKKNGRGKEKKEKKNKEISGLDSCFQIDENAKYVFIITKQIKENSRRKMKGKEKEIGKKKRKKGAVIWLTLPLLLLVMLKNITKYNKHNK